jgi:hypothetical protein
VFALVLHSFEICECSIAPHASQVTVFAYGQTGSGKTYTMLGGERHELQSEGMIPRAVKQIFNTAREGGEMKCSPRLTPARLFFLIFLSFRYTLKAAFIEIYNESVRDLLGKVCS